ncbi:hypothetical protein MD484_g4797, partial [Candolleomyces efflorescens]
MSPDPSEKGDTRLEEIKQQKALLFQERKQLVAKVRDLDYRIACLSTEYGKIHNAAQPISKLPPDVLHLIFHLSRADGSTTIGPTLRKLPEVTLAAVCAQWRHVCLSFGDLWNTFRTKHPGKHAHERLAALLQRSGSHPLDLWFDFREVGLHDLPDRFHLLEDCLKHVHRWRTFTVITDVETPIQYLSERLVETEAPLLERLTLLPNRAYEFDEVIMTTDEPVTLTGGTPKLTYLCLNDLSAAMFTPSLSSVTDLRLDMTEGIENYWIKWEIFLHILRLPSLVTLSIMGQPFPVPRIHSASMNALEDFKLPPVIYMPNLRHLRHASLLGTGFVDLILPNLRAPNLQTLVLKDLNLPSNKEAYWTNNTQLEPFPNLHTLVLIDFEFYSNLRSSNGVATINIGTMTIQNGPPHFFDLELARLTSNAKTLVISDGCKVLSKWKTSRVDPFTSGWKNIETLALNVWVSMYDRVGDFRTFVRKREGLKTLWLPQAFLNFFSSSSEYHGFAKEFGMIEKEGCRIKGWARREEVDGCLGPRWPPGSRDNDGVDDPFAFDLFD